MSTPTATQKPADTSPSADHDEATNTATAARAIGLKPVRAWVPDDQPTARTSGARRTKLSRVKAEQSGLKQLSITLPIQVHPLVKTLALRTKAGEPPETVLRDLLPTANPAPSAARAPLPPRPSIQDMPRWRRWLLARLLPARFFMCDGSGGCGR